MKMKRFVIPFLAGLAFLFIGHVCLAQTVLLGPSLYLPQIADGGNWKTTIVLTNANTIPANVSLAFNQQSAVGGPAGTTTPWTPPFLETVNLLNIPIPPGGTVFLHTAGTAALLTQGFAVLNGAGTSNPLFSAYAIYSYGGITGRQDQDGTSDAVAASYRFVVPFDNTTGLATSIAVVNQSFLAQTISVNIQTDSGTITQTKLPTLPGNGQLTFVTNQMLPATAGKRGLAEFYVTGTTRGNFALTAFRFNPTLAFTSSPVYPQSGGPIIGATSSTGPAFITLQLSTNFAPVGAPSGSAFVIVTTNADGTYAAQLSLSSLQTSGILSPGTATNEGKTFNFDQVASSGVFSTINSASLSFTLTEKLKAPSFSQGNVAGTLTITRVSGIVVQTYTGTIEGTYNQSFLQP